MASAQLQVVSPGGTLEPSGGTPAPDRGYAPSSSLFPPPARRGSHEQSQWEEEPGRAGPFFVLRRVLFLVWSGLRYFGGNLLLWIRDLGRRLIGKEVEDPQLRAAQRLRRTLERMGGTWVKIGQQLSLRTDILSRVYCAELEELLDAGEPLEPEYVRGVVQDEIGAPLEDLYRTPFDFEAVGRGSVACVYRAELLDGRPVAIKVRRPDIRRIFDADLSALDWVLRTAEFLTVVRPGVSYSLRSELRRMLMEELDFRSERRYQELFRRYMKRWKKLRITAPKVHDHLSGNRVIVSDFVTGIWMRELLDTVERGDRVGLERAKRLKIRPKKIAKRLIRASHYQFFECPFFHGDPHPANLLVQPGGRIVMVDFGACGVFSHQDRIFLRQMHEAHEREDVGAMVQCVIHLMEPLPAIDVDAFRAELEHEWWLGFYGIKSKHSSWQERTSFRLWRALFRLVRLHRIPLPLNVLRMIRATLLYDTIGARLYPRLDVFKEYRKFYKVKAKKIRHRLIKDFWRQLLCGPDLSTYLVYQRVVQTSRAIFDKVENFANLPVWRFTTLLSKGSEIFILFLKWFLWTAALLLVAASVGTVMFFHELKAWRAQGSPDVDLEAVLWADMGTRKDVLIVAWLVAVGLITLKYLRQIWFRVFDREH